MTKAKSHPVAPGGGPTRDDLEILSRELVALERKAAAASDVDALRKELAALTKTKLAAGAADNKDVEAGGVLRTSTRPTLDLLLLVLLCIRQRVYMRIHPEDTSCSSHGRVLVLSDPPVRGFARRKAAAARMSRGFARISPRWRRSPMPPPPPPLPPRATSTLCARSQLRKPKPPPPLPRMERAARTRGRRSRPSARKWRRSPSPKLARSMSSSTRFARRSMHSPRRPKPSPPPPPPSKDLPTGTTWWRFARRLPRWAGGSLRTSIRTTVNRRTESVRLYERSHCR